MSNYEMKKTRKQNRCQPLLAYKTHVLSHLIEKIKYKKTTKTNS